MATEPTESTDPLTTLVVVGFPTLPLVALRRLRVGNVLPSITYPEIPGRTK